MCVRALEVKKMREKKPKLFKRDRQNQKKKRGSMKKKEKGVRRKGKKK